MCTILLPSVMASTDICFGLCAQSVSDIAAATNAVIGAGGVIRFAPPYSVDEYIRRQSSCLDARRFAILPTGWTLTIIVGWFECETTYLGWRRRWKYWGGWRVLDDHTHGNFMDSTYVWIVKKKI